MNAGGIPEQPNDICPYATSNSHFHIHQPNSHGNNQNCLFKISTKLLRSYKEIEISNVVIHKIYLLVSSVTLLRRGTPNGASSGSSSGSSASHRLIPGGPGCAATLGRVKNLEMTEYQKEKLINEANTVKIKVTFV